MPSPLSVWTRKYGEPSAFWIPVSLTGTSRILRRICWSATLLAILLFIFFFFLILATFHNFLV